ncbi:MAG: hypothetical protein Q8L39_04380, partial [Burkholderiales bacterium]|nr:hypothetical protein [Burkholderiales bacterium]
MKRSLKFLKWMGITLGVLLVLFIGINAFDETLDPGAAAILSAQPKVKAEDNAYFYWEGMYTAASNDPSEVGKKCVFAQQKIVQSGTLVSDPNTVPECHEQNELKPIDGKLIACEWRKKPCLNQYIEQRAMIESLAAQNRILMERYGRLLEFKQFENTRPFPLFTVFLKAPPSTLYQAISATRLQAGDALGFIRRTQAEARFYRMVLSDGSSLIPKMIGVAWLERSARLVSDAVQTHPMLAQNNPMELLEITHPMNVVERNLGKVMEGEFRFFSSLRHSIPTDNFSFLERLLYPMVYKQNATENYFYHDMAVWREISQLPTEQYLAAEKSALEQLSNPWGDEYLHLVYNPIGKVLVGSGGLVYASYPRRIIDADGLLRLVSLQIQIAAQKIPESDIPAFLKNADPQFRDPYTGQPMQWDKTRGLYFRGYSDRITDKDGFVS